MKRARFVAAARREFLAEVVYYNNKQPGLGSRFAEAVKKVLQKRPYLKKEWCIRVVEEPLRSEPQEHNRYRFWTACPELCGRYLRVVTLEDKVTIHNAFLDRGFKL